PMRRFGRKLDVDEARREIPLSARFFDCLLLGGRPCVARPQRERWHILGELVPPDLRVAALRTADPSALDRFLEQTLEEGHEGLLLKSPDAPYRAGRRGTEWLKWKPAAWRCASPASSATGPTRAPPTPTPSTRSAASYRPAGRAARATRDPRALPERAEALSASPSCCAGRRPGSRRRPGTAPCRAPGRSPRPSSPPTRSAASSPGAGGRSRGQTRAPPACGASRPSR